MARDLNLALIPGDGIGTEVVAEAIKVLDAVAPKAGINVSTTHYDLGATRYNATGELLPDAVIEELRTSDAILLGAIGDPSVPPGVLERGVRKVGGEDGGVRRVGGVERSDRLQQHVGDEL